MRSNEMLFSIRGRTAWNEQKEKKTILFQEFPMLFFIKYKTQPNRNKLKCKKFCFVCFFFVALHLVWGSGHGIMFSSFITWNFPFENNWFFRPLDSRSIVFRGLLNRFHSVLQFLKWIQSPSWMISKSEMGGYT